MDLGLTRHRNRQPPRPVFFIVAGDSLLPGFVGPLFPAVAAQFGVRHGTAGDETDSTAYRISRENHPDTPESLVPSSLLK